MKFKGRRLRRETVARGFFALLISESKERILTKYVSAFLLTEIY